MDVKTKTLLFRQVIVEKYRQRSRAAEAAVQAGWFVFVDVNDLNWLGWARHFELLNKRVVVQHVGCLMLAQYFAHRPVKASSWIELF